MDAPRAPPVLRPGLRVVRRGRRRAPGRARRRPARVCCPRTDAVRRHPRPPCCVAGPSTADAGGRAVARTACDRHGLRRRPPGDERSRDAACPRGRGRTSWSATSPWPRDLLALLAPAGLRARRRRAGSAPTSPWSLGVGELDRDRLDPLVRDGARHLVVRLVEGDAAGRAVRRPRPHRLPALHRRPPRRGRPHGGRSWSRSRRPGPPGCATTRCRSRSTRRSRSSRSRGRRATCSATPRGARRRRGRPRSGCHRDLAEAEARPGCATPSAAAGGTNPAERLRRFVRARQSTGERQRSEPAPQGSRAFCAARGAAARVRRPQRARASASGSAAPRPRRCSPRSSSAPPSSCSARSASSRAAR